MYYDATASARIEQGPWHQQPDDIKAHGTHLPSVLADLANDMMDIKETTDGVRINKWTITLEVTH